MKQTQSIKRAMLQYKRRKKKKMVKFGTVRKQVPGRYGPSQITFIFILDDTTDYF